MSNPSDEMTSAPTPTPKKRVVRKTRTAEADDATLVAETPVVRKRVCKREKSSPLEVETVVTDEIAPVKRKVGRPKKVKVTEESLPVVVEPTLGTTDEVPVVVKRGRGRPRKNPLPSTEMPKEVEPALQPQPTVEVKADKQERERFEKTPPVVRRISIRKGEVTSESARELSGDQNLEMPVMSRDAQYELGAQHKQRVTRQRFVPKQGQQNDFGQKRPQKFQYNNQRSFGQNRQNEGKFGKGFVQKKERFQRENPGKKNYEPIGPPTDLEGVLEITPKGFGFLRVPQTNFDCAAQEAVIVPTELLNRLHLRPGIWIKGSGRRQERGYVLEEVFTINDESLEVALAHPHFEELKAVNPNKRIVFETVSHRYTTRTIDLIAPIGYGQRGLIVAPPRTGKTTLLQHMAEAICTNYPDNIHLMILLVDERPEEVTEFKRALPGVEIFASSNDRRPYEHCRVAELCIERAKRLVEAGKHVFVLMDSITRLARAYNNSVVGTGRTMSGGMDVKAMEEPRRLFAAARNTRQAGSLTIVATALIETNSRMDELIFQEFKGTGNMELVLNRRISEQYIFPAVDIIKSGTRREELIMPEAWLYKMNLIRRAFAGYKPVEAMERFLYFLQKYPSNSQMLLDLKQKA